MTVKITDSHSRPAGPANHPADPKLNLSPNLKTYLSSYRVSAGRLLPCPAEASPAARSGSSSRISVHFIFFSFQNLLTIPVDFNHRRSSTCRGPARCLNKFLQLFAQCFISAEQQRLSGGFTQLQNIRDL